jgi:glycosyltransferase involved in cell wall biosynthesis
VACAHYRLAWPGNFVAEQAGWDVEIHDPGDVTIRAPFAIKGIDDVESLDLVVMQRIATPRQVRLVRAFQRLGIAVVVDVDDLLSHIEKDNKSWAYWNEEFQGVPRWRLLDQATRLADLVTVSTTALAQRYGFHGRVEVLRNGLPNHAFADPTEVYDRHVEYKGEVVVGWSGSLDSHPHDLEVLGTAVADAMRRVPQMRFHVIGDAEPVAQALNLDPSRVTGTGWVPFEEYHAALREVDIALVPLVDSRFNRAKSHLKALEFSAAGAFVMTSPLPEQELLSRTVPTGVANTEMQWANTLEGAAAIIEHRPDLVAEDRAEVVRKSAEWAYANRAGEWVRAWERAVNRRKNLDK